MRSIILSAALFVGLARAHMAPYHPAVYCLDGTDAARKYNSDNIVKPLYQLPKYGGWWFHGMDGCDKMPPPEGTFLDLPAGGSFMVEMAANRGKTTLAFDGKFVTPWGDGLNHPDDYNDPNCIQSPQLHTQNFEGIAGSAFAISYNSDISQVTMENLVVFTTNRRAPWKREAWFQVPKDMPACPPGGCICAWVWIPDGCGQPNIYMIGYKCRVTGATSTKSIGAAKPPVWCEDDPSKCVKGPKQILVWHQAEGDNIEVEGYQLDGKVKSPGYNLKCGFTDGAQNDIFTGGDAPSQPETPSQPSAAPSLPVSSPPANSPPANSPPVNSPPASNPSPTPNPPANSPSPTPDTPVHVPETPSNNTPVPSSPLGVPSATPTRKCRPRPSDGTQKRKRAVNKRHHARRHSHDL